MASKIINIIINVTHAVTPLQPPNLNATQQLLKSPGGDLYVSIETVEVSKELLLYIIIYIN